MLEISSNNKIQGYIARCTHISLIFLLLDFRFFVGAVLPQNFQIIISLNFTENAPNIATQIRKRSTTGAPGVAGLGRNLGFGDLIICELGNPIRAGTKPKRILPMSTAKWSLGRGMKSCNRDLDIIPSVPRTWRSTSETTLPKFRGNVSPSRYINAIPLYFTKELCIMCEILL